MDFLLRDKKRKKRKREKCGHWTDVKAVNCSRSNPNRQKDDMQRQRDLSKRQFPVHRVLLISSAGKISMYQSIFLIFFSISQIKRIAKMNTNPAKRRKCTSWNSLWKLRDCFSSWFQSPFCAKSWYREMKEKKNGNFQIEMHFTFSISLSFRSLRSPSRSFPFMNSNRIEEKKIVRYFCIFHFDLDFSKCQM